MALTLNQFTGAETQGSEEASTVSGAVINTSIKRSGEASWQVETGDFVNFNLFDLASDAGNNYILGFAIRWSDITPTTEPRFIGVSSNFDLTLESTGALTIKDGASAVVETTAATDIFTVDVFSYVEVYWELSVNGAYEVFVDGVSVLQGTGEDFTGTDSIIQLTCPAGATVYFDDIYYLSGATAATDRLGPVEVFGYQAGPTATSTGGTPSNGTFGETGDTPGVEEADGTALEAAGSSSLTLTADLDAFVNNRGLQGGPSITGDTYYFDSSDSGPTDEDTAWSGETNVDDGSISTSAQTTTTAGDQDPPDRRLLVGGTTAPASGGTIQSVWCRLYAVCGDSADQATMSVWTSGQGEDLTPAGAGAFLTGTVAGWSDWSVALATPSGGWTWAKIQALEATFTGAGTFVSADVFKGEIFVQHTSGTEHRDVSGKILGAKYIYNLKRSNGSGTSLRYLYGNSSEAETSSADIEASLTTGFPGIFEQISVAASVVPTSSEDFSVGISAGTDDTGGRSIYAADIWAMLLHAPLVSSTTIAALSGGIMGIQNSFEGPFEI